MEIKNQEGEVAILNSLPHEDHHFLSHNLQPFAFAAYSEGCVLNWAFNRVPAEGANGKRELKSHSLPFPGEELWQVTRGGSSPQSLVAAAPQSLRSGELAGERSRRTLPLAQRDNEKINDIFSICCNKEAFYFTTVN